jgi:hypothetical protein
MGKVLGDSPKEEFAMPDRVVMVPVDLDPSNECVRVVMMAFVKGTEPAVACGPRRQGVPGSPTDLPAPVPASPPGLPQRPQAAAPEKSDASTSPPSLARQRPAAVPPQPDALDRDVRDPAFAGPLLAPRGAQGP